MALSWISHDIIEDNAVTVQYSISSLQTQSSHLYNDAASFTAASVAATADAVAIDAQIAAYLAVPGRP